MKKILVCFLSLILLFTGCSERPQTAEEGKLHVVVTIFPPFDFVRQIAGDRVELTVLVPPGSESHDFEPTLADLSTIRKSDLFIYAGDDSDEWVQSLDSAEYGDAKMLALKDMVIHSDEQSGENAHAEEHLWTSLRNALQIAQGISDALCLADPDNATHYLKNTEKYMYELRELDSDFGNMINASSQKTLVFADRFPFACFAEDYGLQCYAAFDYCSSEFEPTIDVIQDLITKVRKMKIPVVFYIEFSNQAVADMICAATGCEKALFHSCHNVTKEEFADGVTYLSLMRNNFVQLRKALNYAA